MYEHLSQPENLVMERHLVDMKVLRSVRIYNLACGLAWLLFGSAALVAAFSI